MAMSGSSSRVTLSIQCTEQTQKTFSQMSVSINLQSQESSEAS